MENKICGECGFHHQHYHYCKADKECKSVYPENPACEDFTPRAITKGELIRQLSDEELAKLFVCGIRYNDNHYKWYSTLFENAVYFSDKEQAYEATLEEFKKEVKDE